MSGPSISRRRMLALAALASASVVGCGTTDPATIRLASGEEGGFYNAFAQLLATAAAAGHSDDLRIEPVETAGSQQNLRMVATGEVDTALALADSADDFGGRVVALGRVYENYLQLAVRTDGPITQVGDLRGRRVNLGAAGSGAAVTGERVLSAAGLDPAEVTVEHRPLREAAQALTDGTIDALLWAGGVPTSALTVPDPMRLIDLGALAAPMRERYGPVYDRVALPADAYPGSPAVHTIGVANLLLATATLPDELAAAIVDLLVRHADSLVPAEAAGAQFLDGRFLIGTGTIPLHPGAGAAYRRRHG